jgi:hypothetical protein
LLVRQDKFLAWWAQKENLSVLIATRGQEAKRTD